MNRQRTVMLLLVLALIGGATVRSAQDPPAAETPKPEQANAPEAKVGANGTKVQSTAVGLLRVVASPESGLASPTLIGALISRPIFVEMATLSAKLKPTPGVQSPVFTVSLQGPLLTQEQLPPGILEVFITAHSFDAALPANKLWMGAMDILVNKLIPDTRRQNEEFKLKRLDEEVERAQANLAKLQSKYEHLDAEMGMWPAGVQEKVQSELALQVLSAHIAETTLSARIDALRRRIAEVGAEIEARSKDDEVIKELERGVAIREQKLTVVKDNVKQGVIQQGEMLDAETELAVARADLAKYRQSLAVLAGGDRLNELRRHLDLATVESEEASIKRDQLSKQMNDVRSNPDVSILRIEIGAQENRYAKLLEARDELRTQIAAFLPPDVQIVPLNR